MKKLLMLIAVLALGLSACETDADVASRNLSLEADQFRIQRRVVFYNGIVFYGGIGYNKAWENLLTSQVSGLVV